jgi:hypothetical protein
VKTVVKKSELETAIKQKGSGNSDEREVNWNQL